MPLWLAAVILPLISILVIIAMFVTLYRVRRRNAMCQSESPPEKTEQGTDNVGFCFDDNRTLVGAVERQKQHDPMSADEQRGSVEFYCDASLTSVQPAPSGEPEYYEIGSISSAFHSDTASLQLSWHKHAYSTKRVKAEPRRWGDLRMLLAGFKKEGSSEERASKPQNVASLNKLLLTGTDAEPSQHTEPCHMKVFLQPEYLEPVQCLTFEEISKLNTPLDHTMPHRASPHRRTTMINNVSSDSETDSTITGTVSECGPFSIISAGKYIHEQSSLRQQGILPVSSVFKHTSQSAAGQQEAEGPPSRMFEQWESTLNMHLPFSCYAPVFEDIARLPAEPSHSYDVQSDIEEII